MIASRAIAFQATPCGCRACVLAIATTASTWSGYRIAHSNACMPPSDPPATAASRSIPSSSQERALGPHHVRDGDHREVRPVRPPGRRVDRGRPGGPAAAAEQVRGDDEVAVGVERLAGADHPVPPAEPLAGRRRRESSAANPSRVLSGGRRRGEAGRVGVAAERVADQDDVVARGRERAVGLVGHPDRVQLPAAVEPHRPRQVEVLGLDSADRAGRERRGWLAHAGYGNPP